MVPTMQVGVAVPFIHCRHKRHERWEPLCILLSHRLCSCCCVWTITAALLLL